MSTMAPYGATSTLERSFEGGSSASKDESPQQQLQRDVTRGIDLAQYQSHPDANSPQQHSDRQNSQQQSALSTAAISKESGSPSVYDYFHVHHEDDDFQPNSPLILAHKRQNSGSLRSTPSLTDRTPNSRSDSNDNNLKLPPRPPPLIQTALGNASLNGSGSGLDNNSRLSPSPLALQQSQLPPVSHFDHHPHCTPSSHSSRQQSRPRSRNNTHNTIEDDEATPLFAKMQELQQREDPEYVSMTSNHSTAYTLCGFCCSWLVWVEVWILLFAAVIHRHDQEQIRAEEKAVAAAAANMDPSLSAAVAASVSTTSQATIPPSARPWTRLERIYFATSTFWTVGYGDFVVTTKQERLLTCGFLVCSLCFMGLALGRWGNSVIEAYKAASQTHLENKRHQRRRAQRQRQLEEEAENDPMMAFLWNTHQSSTLQRENSMNGSRQSSRAAAQEDFLIFPGLPWLFVQSLFLTALSIFCVFGIQFFEQDEESSDEWTAVSTLYFAISTATATGFGDVVPKQRQGQLLALCFMPLAIGTSLHWMVWMAQRGIQRIQRNMIHRRDLSNLRLDEFYERKLQGMGLVDAATFAALRKEYEQLS
ncbi:MAG: hypothetical protein SGILL_006607 [Bacillariaceae sp.]